MPPNIDCKLQNITVYPVQSRRLIFSSMIASQLSYYPSIWVIRSNKSNNVIKTIWGQLSNNTLLKYLLKVHNKNCKYRSEVFINNADLSIMYYSFSFPKKTHKIYNFQAISNETKRSKKVGVRSALTLNKFAIYHHIQAISLHH